MKTLRLIWLAVFMTTVTLVPSAAGASTRTTAAGKQYLGDMAPLKAMISKWISESSQWNRSTTSTQIQAQTAPFNAALHTFQKRLLDQLWPRRAARAIATMYNSVTFLESTVRTFETSSAQFDEVYLAEVQGQDSITASNANPVRRDLGLTPRKTLSGRKLNYLF
jgi:hypothetical protein